MTLRARRTAAIVLLAGLVPVAAASADSGPTSLALTSVEQVVLDEARGHLFLTAGRTGAGVTVTDLTGSPVTTVAAYGATGIALTPDGTSLWVASPTGVLRRISTTTLSVVETIALPTGQCPGDLALTGSRLVYGYSCSTYGGSGPYGGIGVVDTATGRVLGAVTSGPSYRPVVAAGPAGQVYAADSRISPTGLYLYDVSGQSPQLIAARAQTCSNLADLDARPDGSQVVTACGSPYEHRAYSASKLELVGSYGSQNPYPNAGAWSADGGTFVAGIDSGSGPDVVVYPAGAATPRRSVAFGSSTETLLPRGVAVSADGSRVWAVTRNGSTIALRVLDPSSPVPSSMTLAADPPNFTAGTTTSIGGWLSSGGTGVPGVPLTVSRSATGASPVALPPVTTRSDGTFVFTDTPAAGGYTYTVRWAGDATRAGATASTNVSVNPPGTSLDLSVNRGTKAGSVDGTVRLSYGDGSNPGGRTVSLSRTVSGSMTALTSVQTDQYGGAKFTDTPPAGTVTYTATVAADGTHPAATATATTTVLVTTTLTATAPATAWAGELVTVSGTLVAGTSPVGGAGITVFRTGCGSATLTTTTGTSGAWSVSESPPAGTCTYQASYAGGSGYNSSTATAQTVVSKRPTELTLTVTRGTGSKKKLYYVTAHLGTTHTNRSLTITATSGGSTVTLASGQVDSAGNLKATYQPTSTTTYRATFSGDDWYAPATAERTV
jgi:hypothetical protein